jgi:preprotein translocase subunit SecA
MERFKLPDDQPMEHGLLSKQIENAQKKVEEQNFVARKNVLKYDDVMNTQRMVIYEQRNRVLEGSDLSEEIRNVWIPFVIEAGVSHFTQEPDSDEWDLEGLVAQMSALYGTDVTADEIRADEHVEHRTREGLVQEFVEDALDTYELRGERFGSELAREIERFIVLQVVDTRWREHLDGMDHLREGVHLRAMAQKDPLVEYRGEGHVMFEHLGRAIREEVVFTLFHVEVSQDQGDGGAASSGALEAHGPRGSLSYEHETAHGAEVIAAAGAAELGLEAAFGSRGGEVVAPTPVVNEHRDVGRNDPCWCGSGKKFKRCHGA